MKSLFLVLLILLSGTVSGQTYIIRGDSVKLQKVGGNSELIIENATRATTGVLINYGNGRTRFSKPRINGDTLFIGMDTLVGVGDGSVPLSSITNAVATNTLNNAGHRQTWGWSAITGEGNGAAMKYISTSPNIDGGGEEAVILVESNATNSNSSVTVSAIRAKALNSGSSSTNYGGFFEAENGATNIGVYSSANGPTGAIGGRFLAQGGGNNHAINVPNNGGNVTIGTSNYLADALLNVESTSKAVVFPRMNTTQMNAIAAFAGFLVYNTDSSAYCVYNGTDWLKMGGGGGGTVTGATNGVGLNGTDVELGFPLTRDTYIKGDNFTHSIYFDSLSLFYVPRAEGITMNVRHPSTYVGGFLALNSTTTSLNYSGSGSIFTDLTLGQTTVGGKYYSSLSAQQAGTSFETRIFADSLVIGHVGTSSTASRFKFYRDGKAFFTNLSTGIPSGAKRLLIGTDGEIYAADTTAGGGAVAWSDIVDPTGDQALTFGAGESSTWTNQNTTEDLLTINSSTTTSASYLSLNRTSTALASGNNIMELISSGANGTNGITATGMAISVTNTNATSGTNIGLNLAVSGATTTNRAIESNNLFYFSHNGLWLAGAAPGYMRSSSATGQTIVGHSDGNGSNTNYTLSKIVFQTSGNDRANITSTGSAFGSATAAVSTLESDGSFGVKVSVSSAGTLSLDATATTYVFSGTTTTWTLPAVTGNTDRIYYIKNRGSGDITLNSNAGGNDIYTTSAVNTITIAAGASAIIQNDGTYWVKL